MKLFTVIFLFLFSSCIIIPSQNTGKREGFYQAGDDTVYRTGTNKPAGCSVNIRQPRCSCPARIGADLYMDPTVAYAGVAGVGYGASAATNINKKEFYLVLLDSSDRVIQHEIFHHNIDKKKKPLIEFIRVWSTGKLTGDVDVSD